MSEEQNIEEGNSTISQEQAIQQSEISNQTSEIQKSEIENMEVHHHPHVGKKKFKEYFLEFIMIFLAVTMGFFAESLREHLADNTKEKEIVAALYDDIKKDTANLNIIIYKYMPEHALWEDSAESYVKSLSIEGNEQKIAKSFVNATNWNFYSPPQVSLEVLKNSGNFNLIRSKKIKEEIINFNSLITTYATYSQFVLATEHSVDTATAGIIPRSALRILIKKVYEKTNAQYGSITDTDMPPVTTLKTYDKARFISYINKIDQMDYLLNDLLGLYKKVLIEETKLLELLNNEYHLGNE